MTAQQQEPTMREEIARAIGEAQRAHGLSGFPCECGWLAGFGRGWEDRVAEHRLLAQADAAMAVLERRGGDDAARVRRFPSSAGHPDRDNDDLRALDGDDTGSGQ